MIFPPDFGETHYNKWPSESQRFFATALCNCKIGDFLKSAIKCSGIRLVGQSSRYRKFQKNSPLTLDTSHAPRYIAPYIRKAESSVHEALLLEMPPLLLEVQ